MKRTQTKQIHVGPVAIGGGAPVAVQSMCNTHTSDARATIEQIARLHDAGCEIIRLAVPDQAAADALPEIVHASPIPVVADIHFDYRLAAERFPYPLHVGVTETGTAYNGIIRSAVGIGTLLSEGIGDTIRVSLTADPVEEVRAGIAILKAAGLRREGVRFVSCPTCGRTQIDLIALAQEVEQRLQGLEREITVAVMGCVVNGPGEAHEADYGIAGGKDCGLLFRRGEILGKYPADKLADALVDLILSEK